MPLLLEAADPSGRLWRDQGSFKIRYTVSKLEAALFQAPQQQLVDNRTMGGSIDKGIEVSVLDFEFYQQAFRGVMIKVQGFLTCLRLHLIIRRLPP